MSGEFAEEVAIPAFGVALWGLPEEDFAILESGSTNPAKSGVLLFQKVRGFVDGFSGQDAYVQGLWR